MRRLLLIAVSAALMAWAIPADATAAQPPGYEQVAWGDGAVCNFAGSEAFYGTPGYPDFATEVVLQKSWEKEAGKERLHGSVQVILEGVRYDLISGDGPASFLAYGTLKFRGWAAGDEGFGMVVWHWTLTDLDGNSLGRTGGTIVDFGTGPDEPRLVSNSHGPCTEP